MRTTCCVFSLLSHALISSEKDLQIKQLTDTVNANNQRVNDIRANMDLLAQRQDDLARDVSSLFE